MDEWTVIYWNPTDRWQWTPTEVGERHMNAKDIQDNIAEYAGEHPEIIYMVVKKSDWREFFQTDFYHK